MKQLPTNSLCEESSALRTLAIWTALLLTAATVLARGVGGEWYIISRDGQFLRKLEWKQRDVVDPPAGLTYRLENYSLNAISFEDGAVKWSVHCPLMFSTDGALIQNHPQVLAILANGILYGFDKRNGKELYRAPLGTAHDMFGLPGNHPLRFAWGINANGEDGNFLYLAREKTEIVKRSNGGMELIATQPPVLARFGLSTGAELWERTLTSNVVIYSVSPGFITSPMGPFCFDPATGNSFTNASAKFQPFFTGQTGFFISNEDPGTLTAVEERTQKVLWKLDHLGPVCKIFEPYAYDRLLCATDSQVLVIDTLHHQVKTKFQLPGLNNARFLHTSHVLIAQTYETVRAIHAELGHTLWELPLGHAPATEISPGGNPQTPEFNQQVLLVEAQGKPRERKPTFSVVALAIDTGKQKWRWPVPEGPWGDAVGVYVRPCPSGFAVCRHWAVRE